MFYTCIVKDITPYSPERKFPEYFKLGSEWCFSIGIGGLYYLEGCYFTNNEFNHHFELKSK